MSITTLTCAWRIPKLTGVLARDFSKLELQQSSVAPFWANAYAYCETTATCRDDRNSPGTGVEDGAGSPDLRSAAERVDGQTNLALPADS
jgi:hypothetical protein